MQNCCHYNIIGYLIIIFCSSIIFGITNAGAVDKESVANIKYELTWSDFDGEDYEIFYSSFKNNLWTPEVKITNNDFTDLIPSIGSENDGITWLVWPAIKGSESHLFYSNYDGNRWSHPVQIPTNLSANTSPSVIVDNDNVPWIVWAGFDGQDDDIYFTKWNGYDWDVPLRVNKDDSMPDVLPIIGIDEEGNPWVQWSGYDGENYKKYFSKWSGTKWNDEIVINANNLYIQSTIEKELFSIPDLPVFLKEPDKASIHIRNGGQIHSIRLQNLKKNQ